MSELRAKTTEIPQSPRLDARQRALLVLGAAAVAIVLSVVFRMVYISNQFSWMYDMKVFREAGQRVLDGQTVYWQSGGSLFTHTPFAALLCVPLVLPTLTVISIVWNAITLFCLQALVWLSLRLSGVQSVWVRAGIAVGAAALAFRFDPAAMDLLLGQQNTVFILLLIFDLVVLRGRRWQGLITGVLTGIYLVPGLFVLFLLITRRYRGVAMSLAGFLATAAVGFAALPADSRLYWSGLFLNSKRVGALQNARAQSIADVLARFLHTGALGVTTPLLVIVCCAGGLFLARWLERTGRPFAAVLQLGLASILATPISWNHNYLWVVPALVPIAVVAARSGSALLWVVVTVSGADFLVAPYTLGIPIGKAVDLRLPVGQSLLACTYAVNAVLLIAVLALTKSTGEVGNRLCAPSPPNDLNSWNTQPESAGTVDSSVGKTDAVLPDLE